MVLGFTRLNERTQRPNALINFIKPLETPDKELAQDFLERIAAICYPVMKAHQISVMSLEEFPPNREFVGRNFNAGEVIQLCLKSVHTGEWLSFRSVQLVMMHELAHCKEMNHSRYFWRVRDSYAEHLRELWDRDYYGEGLWGKGQTLLSGQYTQARQPEATEGVKSLCGGVYRGRGRKRKRAGEKPKVSYAERQQRRIQRKFGKHGEGSAVGEDLLTKWELEKGRRTSAKPKVANSKRGRELRAAAALARFGQAAKAEPEAEKSEYASTASDTESETDDEGNTDQTTELVDEKGDKVFDNKGNGLFKVCDDEDMDEESARREMDELRDAQVGSPTKRQPRAEAPEAKPEMAGAVRKSGRIDKGVKVEVSSTKHKSTAYPTKKPTAITVTKRSQAATGSGDVKTETISPLQLIASSTCPVCSLSNEEGSAICLVCAHVLDKSKVPGTWQCSKPECKTSGYLNAGDCGVCGVCGLAKPR